MSLPDITSRHRRKPSQLSERGHQICALVIFSAIIHSLYRIHLQEPRKAEAPQLRDECRSYRILAGCCTSPQEPF